MADKERKTLKDLINEDNEEKEEEEPKSRLTDEERALIYKGDAEQKSKKSRRGGWKIFLEIIISLVFALFVLIIVVKYWPD